VLPITFLSDYGYEDEYVGVCHGVIQRIAPGITVIDIAHGLPRQDVRVAALTLRNALPYMPRGVHLAIVDPGVGTDRRPVAIRSLDGHLFVGPDNGLFWPSIDRCGGADLAIDLEHSPYRLDPVSATFHGRDLFAPVAARLALETPIEHAGAPVPITELNRIDLPRPKVLAGDVTARVLAIDRFGNAQLNLYRDQMAKAGFSIDDAIRVQAGRRSRRATFVRTFGDADAGETIVFEDSTRSIALGVSGGDAAATLALRTDSEVKLRPWSREREAPAAA
jgi:S-adenosyl-L-methionine hydrolase (adenosine-forming)